MPAVDTETSQSQSMRRSPPASWPPATETVAEKSELAAARNEIAQLQEALRSRAAIDQLKGMIMVVVECDADAAWLLLVRLSQTLNTKIHNIAEETRNNVQIRSVVLSLALTLREQTVE